MSTNIKLITFMRGILQNLPHLLKPAWELGSSAPYLFWTLTTTTYYIHKLSYVKAIFNNFKLSNLLLIEEPFPYFGPILLRAFLHGAFFFLSLNPVELLWSYSPELSLHSEIFQVYFLCHRQKDTLYTFFSSCWS